MRHEWNQCNGMNEGLCEINVWMKCRMHGMNEWMNAMRWNEWTDEMSEMK